MIKVLNYRGLNKSSIFDITVSDSDTIPYFPRPEEDRWKTETLQLMMREREQGRLDDADQAVMDHLCENWVVFIVSFI